MIPEQLFTKEDSNDDRLFYASPRLVKHIDENACQVLKNYYDQLLKDGDAVLDLMSSWVSHLPEHKHYSRVAGHGMNQIELQNNAQLTDFHIQNLNTEQQLPYGDEEFDLCTIAVSVQYLTSPVQVFKEIYRVLKPNGTCCVSFPTECSQPKQSWLGECLAARITVGSFPGTLRRRGSFVKFSLRSLSVKTATLIRCMS